MAKKLGGYTEAMPTAKYKILIGIVGFVNDHTKIARHANAVLELNPDVALGEHTLFLKATVDIKPGAEILLAYGFKNEFSTPRRKKIGAKRRRTAANAGIPDTAGGVDGAFQPDTAAAKAETDVAA